MVLNRSVEVLPFVRMIGLRARWVPVLKVVDFSSSSNTLLRVSAAGGTDNRVMYPRSSRLEASLVSLMLRVRTTIKKVMAQTTGSNWQEHSGLGELLRRYFLVAAGRAEVMLDFQLQVWDSASAANITRGWRNVCSWYGNATIYSEGVSAPINWC